MSPNEKDHDISRFSTIFKSIDRDKDGKVSINELRAAMKGSSDAKALTDTSERLFSKVDTDSDAEISFSEFVDFIRQQETQLRLAFDSLDRNNDQQVDATEIREKMADIGVKVSQKEAERLLSKMDEDGSCTIDFDEWRNFLMFSDSTDLTDIFNYWRRATAIDIGENGVVPDDFSSTEKKSGVALKTLVSGGVAGMISRSCTAPLDRVKLMWQAQAGKSLTKTAGSGNITTAIRHMITEGGVSSLWRGNGINCLKIAPETAVKFLAYENYKALLIGNEQREVTLLERFMAGALAGATAQTIIYPMEMLKTRMCLRKTGQYSSIIDCTRKIYAEAGLAVFYRGYVPNILGILPYAGIDLALFETFKKMWTHRVSAAAAATGGAATSKSSNKKAAPPPIWVSLLAGAFSSVCGQVATYPLALVRTKMQTRPKESLPLSTLQTFQRVVAKEGLTGLYRGLGPNMVKVIPAVSISYAIFDQMRSMFDIK